MLNVLSISLTVDNYFENLDIQKYNLDLSMVELIF